MTTPCIICNNSQADTITLYYFEDPWDTTPPYTVSLCRDHQAGLIEPVQQAIKKMKGELNAKNA